ncbi:hypothetical protein ACPB9E_06855 [Streptomyces exfoliatus]|uniref:hypothetical protein n=1 Tax=Streptomyces exfoliatus TaxID=1905 RepID=UPI003C2FCE9D
MRRTRAATARRASTTTGATSSSEGLAERRRDPADRRRHIVEITEAGAAVLGRVDAAVGEAERELSGDLTEAEQALFRSLLDRVVVDAADHDCGGAE